MIALAALLMAGQAAPEPEVDIVVVAQRLAAIEVAIGKDAKGRFTCGLSQSSGSPKLDARLCKASAACAKKHGSDGAAVKTCVSSGKPKLLAQLRTELARSRAR